ncbi:YisL family protein [Sporosarcina soli]|uniref:YisL family protein n=1 Tax=Sporosarcina soli TaxID=334736 RepID=UPI0036D3A655
MNEVTVLDALASSTHFHIFTWVVGIVLFLVAAVMANGTKGRKITHMIARLFYVLIVISGALLFFKYSSADAALYGVKFLLGLLTIGMMEMVLVRADKGKSISGVWILFFVFLFATMYLGFKLPVNISWFA